MRKINRNENCPCGSKKKFKKCCMNKQTKQSKINQVNRVFKLLNFQDHIKYTPQKKSHLLYVINSNNLPSEVSITVSNYIENQKIIKGGCWYNSSHLSLIDSRIEIVHGYYGEKMTKEEFVSISSSIKIGGLCSNNDGWYPFEDEYGKGFYDLKNKTILSPHSWNQFENIYFDLTKENDTSLKNNWINYYPIKRESTCSLDSQTKNKIIKMVIERKKNRFQIN
tara:strand:- start:1646 stop:2314 length:669 start_codon:yes stop_codon:yes gene_type:complete